MTRCSAGPAARTYGAGWQYDGSSPSWNKVSLGTCFVTCGIVVHLPFCTRPVCLPVLGRLILPGKKPRGAKKKAAPAPGAKVSAATGLVALLAAAFPGRPSTWWPMRPITAWRANSCRPR